MTHPLAELFSSGRLTPGGSAHGPTVFTEVADPAQLITIADVRQKLELSLLRSPYLVVRRGWDAVPVREYTRRKHCVGVTRDGFVDALAVRRLLEDGASVELHRLADWHLPIRRLTADIEERAPIAVSARAVLQGPQATGGLRAPGGGSGLVVQLSGRSGGDVELNPGDALYLPPGHTGRLAALDHASLRLALEFFTPTLDDVVSALRQHFVTTNPDLIMRHHRIPSAMRSATVRERLLASVRGMPEETWQSDALAHTRQRTR